MTTEDDLSRIVEQEKVLSFDAFDLTTAWQLGKLLQELATERGLGIAIDVTLHSMPVFYAALPGVTPDNVNWVRRKRNMVLRYFRSSYASGLKLQRDGKTVEDNGLSGADFAPHGGSFPINVKGTGCIGAVTVSGLPQRDDHNLAVEALALMLAKDLDTLRLAPLL
ncbi:heme-degrading domain-containing protein [Rhizobium leguminosarum bv. viciae]|uniref:heme-degrading domain-containing protein n=1 Tax=Rhizobium leguminosarum TaxID=384 RepID=UPI00144252FF|nr:heme-degrading domain-containing protein [Rhizobium leguminosarum]NKL02198.1 heme-degrading domain-containing protein [Rhizobium leguminosarum bv. viciae]